MLAEGIAACPVPWQHLAYSSGETEEVTSCKVFSFPPAPSTSRSSFKESGAKKHRIAGVQKESNFPRPFGILSARKQFRVSCLENGSVCSHWQKERGAAALLSGQRAHTQHGRRPLPEEQTLPQHRGQREWAGSL